MGNKITDGKLSTIQERLFTHIQMQEVDPYNVVAAFMVDRKLNLKKFEYAVNQVIRRHESLRTCFYVDEGGKLKHSVSEWAYLEITKIKRDSNANNMISQAVKRFDLSKAPLMNVTCIDMGTEKNIIVFDLHHMVADGGSMDIVVREILTLYIGGQLDSVPKQYSDFILWEQAYLESDDLKKSEEYWCEKLSGAATKVNLPFDTPEGKGNSQSGDTVVQKLSADLLRQLKSVAREKGCTLYMLLLGAFNVLLHHMSFDGDITVLTPVSWRGGGNHKDSIGMYTNTLVINNQINSGMTWKTLFETVRETCVSAFQHGNYPLNMIVNKLKLQPIDAFNVMFVYENVDMRRFELDGTEIEELNYFPDITVYDFCLEINEGEDGINAFYTYRTSLFKRDSIDRIVDCYLKILGEIVNRPDITVGEIDITDSAEKRRVLEEFNNTAAEYERNKTVAQLFEEQVEKKPDNVAVVYGEERLTYRELNEKANALAHKLREMGVKPDDFVAIIAERSVEMILGVYGVIKSGGAYVPIDPTLPEDRIQYILEDCKPKALLTYGAGVKSNIPSIDLAGAESWKGGNPEPVNKPKE